MEQSPDPNLLKQSELPEQKGGKKSITFKLIAIGFLILIFLIPAAFVQKLVRDRSERKIETIDEVSSKWGGQQIVTGPILVVPYSIYGANSVNPGNLDYVYFLPDNLTINGEVAPEVRSRGIYDVALYDGTLTIKGYFSKPSIDKLNVSDAGMFWNKAVVTLGITDMRGVQEQIKLNWSGSQIMFDSGVKGRVLDSGVNATVPLKTGVDGAFAEKYEFTITLDLRGSEELYFMPVGKDTTVTLNSTWQSPSFSGSFLPTEHNVSPNGFDATWHVLDLNRNFPQQWTSKDSFSFNQNGGDYIEDGRFGVKLFFPVDVYQKSERSAKYAIAVIALVFVVFLFVEITSKRRIHPLQYLLVGFALVIFYTLLLSLAEYIKFGYAYLMASSAIIAMVGIYSWSVFKSKALGFVSAGILALLYAFIYVLLQMQDYTLLIGSIGLFVILGIIMYVSRYINWYGNEDVK